MLPSPPSPIDQPLTQDAQPWDPWQEPLSGLDLDLVLAIQQHDLNALQRVREDGPFAPGCHERERAYPLLLALIEQRLLREHLNDAPIETVRNVVRPQARL